MEKKTLVRIYTDSRCSVHRCNSKPSIQTSCGHWFCFDCALRWFSNSNQTCPRAGCGKVVEKIEKDTFELESYPSYLTGEEKVKCQPSNTDGQYLVGTSDFNVAPFEHESHVQEPHLPTYQGTAVDDDTFLDSGVAVRKKYTCPKCGYLLRDAVQTSCGHWFCHDCAVNLFKKSSTPVCPHSDCGETLEIKDGKEFFPDKFVRKEISKFQVRCRYYRNNCRWTGTLIEQLKHLEVCTYQQEECPHCNNMFSISKIIEHERNCPKALVFCPFVEYGCEETKEMTRADCDKHLKTAVASHSRLLAVAMKNFAELKEKFEEKQAVSSAFREGLSDQPGVLSGRVQSNGPSGASSASGGGGEIDYLKKQITSKDSQIRHLQDKLQQVEATILAKTTENEDRDFRLSLMENSNYDGTMLWKVPQFTQRMDDARTGKYTSIFSLPFYSGRYGYKMCLRLYILGDGIGKGSHMSLFFVLMKGEFDNIQQWPFNHKVTFKLINQCRGRDVVDVFQPDPLSSSFQKPKTDMNIASGCPRFVSLNELMQNGFVIDDTIFIKVKVDTTRRKHPLLIF